MIAATIAISGKAEYIFQSNVKVFSFRRRFMKKTLVYLFPLVVILCLIIPRTIAGQDDKLFVGTWNGTIRTGGSEIGIIVKFSLDESGQLVGTIDVPAQGNEGLSLSNIKAEGKKITFMIDNPGIPGEPTFNGTLDGTGKKIEGVFIQGLGEGSFNLEKE